MQMVYEISAFLSDYRADKIGGLKCGLILYEMVILPSLLNSCDTWFMINNQTLKMLENIQISMFRQILLACPSTPQALLRFDLGSLKMSERIEEKKLLFLHFLKSLPSSSLASEIFEIQRKYNLIGLVSEMKSLISKYEVPDIISNNNISFSKAEWKKIVKKAVHSKSQCSVLEEIRQYSKLKYKNFETEGLGYKNYFDYMTTKEAQTNFRLRSSTFPVKINMKSDKKFTKEAWRCDSCFDTDSSQKIESQLHILNCPSYESLREGKSLQNDIEVVQYFQEVQRIREQIDDSKLT